jgi:hypothetical protein
MNEVTLKKTLQEWNEIYMGVQALMQESLPFKEAYWIARDSDRIETAVKSLDTLRKKMLDEYCDKDDNDQPIMTPAPDGLQGMQYQLTQNGFKFQQEWIDIVSQEIEIAIFLISVEKIGEKLESIKPIILKSVMCLFVE